MNWTIPMISNLRKYADINNIELKSFALKAVDNYVSDAFLITGVDSLKQLKENIHILNQKKYPEKFYKKLVEKFKIIS